MKNRLPFLFGILTGSAKSIAIGLWIIAGLSITSWAGDREPIKAPTALSVSVNPATAVCAGTSVALTASGCPTGGTLRWSTSQTGATITVVPTQTTTYTAFCDVTTTSVVTTTATSTSATSTSVISTTSLASNVATTSATGTVQVNTPIVLTANTVPVSCNNEKDGQVSFTASGGTGGLQYQFNNQGYQTINTIFGNLRAGSYPILVKDGGGCIAQTTAVITQPAPLTATITIVGAKCTGGTDGGFVAVASGGNGNYRYILNNNTPQESGTFVDLKANTTYSLLISDKNGCVASQSVFVGAPNSFSIQPTSTSPRCVGSSDGSVAVSVTGGVGPYQYQIGTGGDFQAGAQFTGLTANTYEITVKDNNGCIGKQSAVVNPPAPFKLTAAVKPVNCFGPNSGTITVAQTGGVGAITYQLSAVKIAQVSNVFGGLTAGDYTVLATDANGCSSLVPVSVSRADPLKIQATVTPATCCVCPTGAVKLNITGGTGTGRQYQLNGQALQTNGQVNGLGPATYRFRIVDEAGCVDSVAAVVTNAGALTLTTVSIKDVSCVGGQDGEATVQVAGGKKPFTYYWVTERKDTLKMYTATQATLPAETFTVSVLDSNRCTTSTAFVSLKAKNPVPIKPVISQVASSTLSVVDQPAGIQWYVRSGNNAGVAVPNATGPILIPFASGQYYVTVTQNGCASPPSEAINFVLTALAEPDARLSVRVVPNPVVDRLRLEIEQVERSAVQIQLLDASGRAVWAQQLPAFTGKKQAEWPLTGISTGTYLLKAAAESRQSVIRVLVE